jgi:hypothetical protein
MFICNCSSLWKPLVLFQATLTASIPNALSCHQAYVHLECKNYFKFTKEISSLSHRLLLYGPTGMYTIVMIVSLLSVVTYISIGTEIYQEYLMKALAKYFDTKFLTVDSSMLFCVRPWAFTSIFFLWLSCDNNYYVF